MKIQFGSFEVELDVKKNVNDVLELTLRDVISSRITIRNTELLESVSKEPRLSSPAVAETPPSSGGLARDLQIIREAGFPTKTIVIISNHLLGIKASGDNLLSRFEPIKQASLAYMHRDIPRDGIWALFVGQIQFAQLGQPVMAVGLTKENQLVPLGLDPSAPKLFTQLAKRGLSAKNVKLGILPMGSLPKTFKESFPNAEIQYDWSDFIDLTVGNVMKEQLREAMFSNDKKKIEKLLATVKGPKELTTYLNYDKRLWRALKAIAPIRRIEKEFKLKVKSKLVDTTEQRDLLVAWTLLRLNYHWRKIPVDSEQLSNLRYIKLQEQI